VAITYAKDASAASAVVKAIERDAERRSQFRRTPLMPKPSKPRRKTVALSAD